MDLEQALLEYDEQAKGPAKVIYLPRYAVLHGLSLAVCVGMCVRARVRGEGGVQRVCARVRAYMCCIIRRVCVRLLACVSVHTGLCFPSPPCPCYQDSMLAEFVYNKIMNSMIMWGKFVAMKFREQSTTMQSQVDEAKRNLVNGCAMRV